MESILNSQFVETATKLVKSDNVKHSRLWVEVLALNCPSDFQISITIHTSTGVWCLFLILRACNRSWTRHVLQSRQGSPMTTYRRPISAVCRNNTNLSQHVPIVSRKNGTLWRIASLRFTASRYSWATWISNQRNHCHQCLRGWRWTQCTAERSKNHKLV
jgi:hypothetical protein